MSIVRAQSKKFEDIRPEYFCREGEREGNRMNSNNPRIFEVDTSKPWISNATCFHCGRKRPLKVLPIVKVIKWESTDAFLEPPDGIIIEVFDLDEGEAA